MWIYQLFFILGLLLFCPPSLFAQPSNIDLVFKDSGLTEAQISKIKAARQQAREKCKSIEDPKSRQDCILSNNNELKKILLQTLSAPQGRKVYKKMKALRQQKRDENFLKSLAKLNLPAEHSNKIKELYANIENECEGNPNLQNCILKHQMRLYEEVADILIDAQEQKEMEETEQLKEKLSKTETKEQAKETSANSESAQ